MAKKKTNIILLEETEYAAPSKVDREAGIIRGVKVLGIQSRNGYKYSKAAIREAVRLYEGCGVHIDHPSRDNPKASRSMRDKFGKLVGVRETDDGAYGDLHYLKTHPMAEQICELAERMPDQFGLSHVADVARSTGSNGDVIESVSRVRSVDVVGKPATNSSIFEDEEPMKTKKINELFKDKKPFLTFLEEMEPGMSAMPVEMPSESPDSDEAAKAAFRAMIVAAFDDDSLDMQATIARIKDVVKSYYKLTDKDEPTDGGGDESSVETPTTEELRLEMVTRDRLWKAGIEPTKAKVKALMVLESDEDRQELIETMKPKTSTKSPGTGKTPKSITTLEDDDEDRKVKIDGKSFAAAVSH